MTLCPTIQGIVSAEILANYGRLSTGELTATCTQQDQVCFGLMRNTPENHGTVSGSWHDPSFCDTTNQPVEIQMSESGQHYWTSSTFQEVHPPRPHWYSAIKLAGNLHSDLSIHWSSTFCYLFLTCSFCGCLTLLFHLLCILLCLYKLNQDLFHKLCSPFIQSLRRPARLSK